MAGAATGSAHPARVGSATCDTTPDLLEQLTGSAIRDWDWDQLHLLPSGQKFAQVGLGEEVHRLAGLLGYVRPGSGSCYSFGTVF